ncbi:MAG: NAD(P)-dependent oxidoreductase [Capsulimonadaceae bacterium]
MAIYFFEASSADRAYVEERLPGEDLHFFSEPLTSGDQIHNLKEDQISGLKDVEILSVFLRSHIGADVIDALPELRMISTRSTGFRHVNVPAAESRGIPVCNVPTYGENTVAEHTFALMLALTRNLHIAYTRTSAGDFRLDGLQGIDLRGRTLGVVGAGHVGMHVIQIARGFGMKVLASDPVRNDTAASVLGYKYTTLDELLAQSDIVTLHARLTSGSYHLIGEHNIDRFKRGAFLINTAGGGLVDTQALLKALDTGILRGAGLDVVEGEEVFSEDNQFLYQEDISQMRLRMALQNMSLLRRSDLIVTPHLAYDSREAVERIFDTTIENIKALRSGEPQNCVHT